MPIILLIVSTLAFWTLYWFVQMGGIDHFRRQKAQRKEEAQRQEARERARVAPLRAVDDPRDAVAILMVLIARANGDPTREQIVAIEEKLRSIFGFERELPERMTQARFIARQADSFEQAAAVFARCSGSGSPATNAVSSSTCSRTSRNTRRRPRSRSKRLRR